MNNAALGKLSLISALVLLLALLSVILAELTREAWSFEENLFLPFSVCGIFFAPLVPLLIFLVLYFRHRQKHSRMPILLVLVSLAIAISLGILATAVRTWDLFSTDAAVGQSLFAAVGIWLALANWQAIKDAWLPKFVALSGVSSGVLFSSTIFLAVMGAVNPQLRDNALMGYLQLFISVILLPLAALIWATGLGFWLRSSGAITGHTPEGGFNDNSTN